MSCFHPTATSAFLRADIVNCGLQALPIRQFLMTNLVKTPQRSSLVLRIPVKTLASSLSNMGDFPFKDPDEAQYKGPTLFVRGTKSHYVADDVVPVIGRFFPQFVMRDIDCGHWVISEQPQAFRQGKIGDHPFRAPMLIRSAVVDFFEDLEKE